MKTHTKLLDLVHNSETFLINTIDSRDFPATMAVSSPIKKEGLQRLTFYIDNQSEAAKNVLRISKGSVFCYNDQAHESLMLSGTFALIQVEASDYLDDFLTDYQRSLNHLEPVLLQFTTIFAKAHFDKQTKSFIL